MLRQYSKSRGFTIIELITIIAVIGILATIGIVSWSGAQNRARQNSFQANAEQVKLRLGELFTENSRYPKNKDGVCTYLQTIHNTTLHEEFCTGANNAAYSYAASGSSTSSVTCYDAGDTPNTPVCVSYTITVAKSNWSGGSSDTDIIVRP